MHEQRLRFSGMVGALCVAAAMTAGEARAESPNPPSTPAAPASTRPASTPKEAVFRAEGMANSEKLAKSAEFLSHMRSGLKLVLAKLEEARSSRDVVKLNCVNEKLTNIKGLLRISEQADVSLQESVARREEQAADHEFTKVAIARQKIEQLKAEAEQCVGLLAFETGPTEVIVQEPADLPALDPTSTVPPPPVVIRNSPESPTS
jgi:hypothetical protein